MTPPGRDNNIDSVLKHFDNNIFVSTKAVEEIVGESEKHNTISQMLAIGIFQLMPDTIATNNGGLCYILTAFGIEVKRHGSWTKYLTDKEEEKQLTVESINTSIRTNKSSESINILQSRLIKWTIAFSIIATLISFFSLYISFKGLRLQEKLLELEEHKESGEKQQQGRPDKKKETVLPNSDSSTTTKADSLQ